jgi:EpsI family protein
LNLRLGSSSWRFGATVLLLGGTAYALHLANERVPDKLVLPLRSVPVSLGGWVGQDSPPLDQPTLDVLLPTSYLERTYSRGAERLELFISYYAQQRAGEAMHSPKNCLPGAGWEIWNYGSLRVPFEGQELTINKYSIQNGGERRVVLYWYQSKGRVIASEYLGKVLLLRDSILQGSTAGSIVRVIVLDAPESVRAGIDFSGKMIAELRRCFGG